MRKEQQKALQEKQQSSLEKSKADASSDISVLSDDINEEKVILDRDNELDSTTNPSISSIDSGKCALPSHATCRPLVPPGFKNAVVEKTSGVKSLTQSYSVEVTHMAFYPHESFLSFYWKKTIPGLPCHI